MKITWINFFACCLSGLVFFEVLLRLDILTHPMENCDGGFEAATIGGFADWFAVSFVS
jgi:uncharacterized membrane-anchored protein YjiN (DUF445 family)